MFQADDRSGAAVDSRSKLPDVHDAVASQHPIVVPDAPGPDQRYMQTAGNLVLYGPSSQVCWSTGTAGHPGTVAAIQSECDFVLCDDGMPIWSAQVNCQ